jgi:hypothetical protein
LLKPLSLQKSKRLPERKAVTIIAGFSCPEGVVVCADTQETVEGISKKHVTKVKVEPSFMKLHELVTGSNLAVVFAGSGEGPFTDMLTRKVWDAAKDASASTLTEVCEEMEDEIKEVYREYKDIFPRGECPDVELIYGLKMNGESRLFYARGPVVNQVDKYCSGGIGYYMADFLASRMPNTPTLHQAVILAAYILFQAKEHVDGCGGESHIGILRNNGESGMIKRGRIEAITRLLDHVDRQLGEVLLAVGDLRPTSNASLGELENESMKVIDILRSHTMKEVKDYEHIFVPLVSGGSIDDFGFFIDSKEPEQAEPQEPEERKE